MALRKSKIEILDKIIKKADLIDQVEYGFWWDYDDDEYDSYCCDNCGSRYCDDYSYCQSYEYQEEDDNKVIYISRSFGKCCVINNIKNGKFIDMNTIYSKEVIRQKKINYLLGIDKYEIQNKPTIGDLFEDL